MWPDNHPLFAGQDPKGTKSDVRTDTEKNAGYATNPSNKSFYVRIEVGSKQEKDLYRSINKKDTWGYTHTCADWAADVFKAATGIDLDTDDWFGLETPRELAESIDEMPATSPTSPYILK